MQHTINEDTVNSLEKNISNVIALDEEFYDEDEYYDEVAAAYAPFKEPFAHIQRKMQLLLSVGQLLMENGANTHHIIRDLLRCAAYMGIPKQYIHIYISYHTIMINVNGDYHSATAFRKASKHRVDMNILSALSKLSWHALEHQYSLDKFEEEVVRIGNLPRLYNKYLTQLGVCIASSALTLLFGGTILAALVTFIATNLGLIGRRFCEKYRFNGYITIALTAFIATATTSLFYTVFPTKGEFLYAIISCTLFMIPGVPLVNAIDDLMNMYIVSGTTRLIHAILIVCGITFGMAMAIHFLPAQNFATVPVVPKYMYIIPIIGGCCASIGFSILFNVPRRLLLFIACGGLIAVGLRNMLIVEFGVYAPGATFIGTATVGLLMGQLAYKLNTSPLIVSIPSVVPLVPGLFFYRFLFSILEVRHLDPHGLLVGVQNGVLATLISLSIAIGITVSSMFGQEFIDKKKEEKMAFFIEKRRANLDKNANIQI